MYVQWKSLLTIGVVFWSVLCVTDFFGEPSWKKYSSHVEDILQGHHNEITQMQRSDEEVDKKWSTWSMVLWNSCAFLCSLIFCSVLRSMSWVVWKMFKIYNFFRNRQMLTDKIVSKSSDGEESGEAKQNCQVLFQNQLFAQKQEAKWQEYANVCKQLEDIKSEKNEIVQQLAQAQKENLTARQQIEEYKLETFMMKEKLTRTANTLKENMRFKDFASAHQELIARKAHNLEVHLKEVCKDREMLRNKLSILEKNFMKMEERLRQYENQESEINNDQPEKDDNNHEESAVHESIGVEVAEPDVDMCKFQKKILELQRNIGNFDGKQTGFEANSKISMDLEESSLDTSKENDCEVIHESKGTDVNFLKQNLLNYNAYKMQMLKPKMRLGNVRERKYSTDTTGSSSDDNSGPQRIISSTVEFQNFLKTLSTNSNSSVNFTRNVF